MIYDLKPYQAYKASAVPWLGQLPAHWDLPRAKTLLRERSEKGFPDEPLLAATQNRGVIRKDRYENRTVLALKDLHLLKRVRVGDFVISLRSFQGGIEYARDQGIISPAYTILYPRQPEIHGYLAWLFKSQPFVENLTFFVTGIRQGQNIDYERLSRSELPLPPSPDQAAITRFLDHADRRIQRYIRAKRKLIALLNEQKQAIIHRAVTRGLDPNVHLKLLPNRWFPEIPEHWDVLPMRRLIRRAVDGPHHSPQYLDEGIPFLSARHIKADRWNLHDAKYISEDDYKEFCKRVTPELGDVLYTKGGTTGVARAVDLEFPFQVWVHVAVLKLNKGRVSPEFLAAALNTPRCYEQAQLFTRGATNQDLGLGRMKDIMLPAPPLSEQEAIVEFIKSATVGLEQTLDSARLEVDLLNEYRTRLIADVVTGNLDVRDAAARLPEEPEEPELFDEDGVMGEDEAEGEGAGLEAAPEDTLV